MSNATSGSSQREVDASPLEKALDENKVAAAEVKRAAEDLAVVHAVLDTKIAQGSRDRDVKRAVDETNKVEKRLDESAEKLERVNETLESEIRRTH